MYSLNPDRRGAGITKLLELAPWQFYPEGEELNASFLENGPPSRLQITRQTPIASIGSCFAWEIKKWLQARGFAFIQAAEGPCCEFGSARYDRVYNTFTMRQEFERAFGHFAPQETCWKFVKKNQLRLMDPYRKSVAWDDEADMQRELAEHADAVRAAFRKAELLIVTLGQAEIWYHRRDGYVYPQAPPAVIFDAQEHGFRLSSYEENLANLERIVELYTENNPLGQILLTVSPIPLRCTFRSINSMVANTAGKSILRAAADAITSRYPDRITYFPAYELVSALPRPFDSDNRHVTQETIDRIMALFEARFVRSAAQDAA